MIERPCGNPSRPFSFRRRWGRICQSFARGAARKDLREWRARAEALGELKTLKGVHWDLEIGAITEMVGRQLEKPAILFDEVPGYPPGHRVLVNALGSRNRYAM